MSRYYIEQGLGWKYTPEKIERCIRDRAKNVLVARAGSQLAGFAIMTYGLAQANLDLLAVEHCFRRTGIGTRLVQWLEEVALTAGIYNIFVQVRAGNCAALKFYGRLGYRVVDEKPGYYQGVEAGIIEAKNLRPMFNFSSFTAGGDSSRDK